MKKIISLIICILVIFNYVDAQNERNTVKINCDESPADVYVRKITQKYSSKESLKSNSKQLFSVCDTLILYDSLTPYSKTISIYNSLGLSTEIRHYYLDPVNYQLGDVTYLQYNSNNLLSTQIRQNVSNGIYTNIYKVEYQYDNQNNQTAVSNYNWLNNVWNASNKIEYQYDNQNNQTVGSSYSWLNNVWDAIRIDSLFYSASNQLIEHKVYDKYNNSWIKSYTWKYYYYVSNDTNIFIQEAYIGDTLNSSGKVINIYNSANLLIETTSFYKSGSIWNPSTKNTYTYNSQNQIIEKDIYVNDGLGLNNTQKENYYYSNSNNADSCVYSYLKNSIWLSMYYTYFTYDQYSNITSYIYKSLSDSLTVNYILKEEYTFDNYGNSTKCRAYMLVNGVWTLMRFQWLYQYINSEQAYLHMHISGYDATYKSFNSTGIELLQNPSILFYPNPAIDKIYFANPQPNAIVSILSIDGKLVSSTQLINQNSINVSSLSPGIYLIRLVNSEGITTQKFLKK